MHNNAQRAQQAHQKQQNQNQHQHQQRTTSGFSIDLVGGHFFRPFRPRHQFVQFQRFLLGGDLFDGGQKRFRNDQTTQPSDFGYFIGVLAPFVQLKKTFQQIGHPQIQGTHACPRQSCPSLRHPAQIQRGF